MKTLEMRDKNLIKLKGCRYKIANTSAAMHPSVSNLVSNQCIDILRLPYGQL